MGEDRQIFCRLVFNRHRDSTIQIMALDNAPETIRIPALQYPRPPPSMSLEILKWHSLVFEFVGLQVDKNGVTEALYEFAGIEVSDFEMTIGVEPVIE